MVEFNHYRNHFRNIIPALVADALIPGLLGCASPGRRGALLSGAPNGGLAAPAVAFGGR